MGIAKAAYIVCSFLGGIFFFSMAVITPVFVTPGLYWWSALFVALAFASSRGFTARLNSWGDFGEV